MRISDSSGNLTIGQIARELDGLCDTKLNCLMFQVEALWPVTDYHE